MAFEINETLGGLDGKLLGRRVLYSSFSKNELNPLTIASVLKDVLPLHFKNAKEIDFLKGYYKGNQEIWNKTKNIRSDINNKVLENNAYHIIEFSKGFVFGQPIQYVQRGDTQSEEVDRLNDYMIAIQKSSVDMQLSEDWYIGGNAYRWVAPNQDDEDAPFKIKRINPKSAFVVYDTSIDENVLFAGYVTTKKNYVTNEIYYILTIYTEAFVYEYQAKEAPDATNEFEISSLLRAEPNFLGEIPIIEYSLNNSRLGKIEIVKTVLDTLNKISSNDIDDIEQFVQSLLVFINAEIDEKGLSSLMELGAVNIKNNGAVKGIVADIKLLSQKLSHSETKVLYDRLYNNMLTIVGIPRMTDKTSSGDTGQARLVGEGWTMANEKANQDEHAFKKAEKQLLKIVLKICKSKPSSKISQLNAKDIDIKFTRNKSDNLLVKTQGLMNMMSAQVPPEVAFESIDLFSDSSDVIKKAKAFYGDKFWKQDEVENTNGNNANSTNETIE